MGENLLPISEMPQELLGATEHTPAPRSEALSFGVMDEVSEGGPRPADPHFAPSFYNQLSGFFITTISNKLVFEKKT